MGRPRKRNKNPHVINSWGNYIWTPWTHYHADNGDYRFDGPIYVGENGFERWNFPSGKSNMSVVIDREGSVEVYIDNEGNECMQPHAFYSNLPNDDDLPPETFLKLFIKGKTS